MSFEQRYDTPERTDKKYINTVYGGYNRAIAIGSDGFVLPNCVGYVHGRWMEIGNSNVDYNLSVGNASTFWGHSDSYERGQEPRVGAVVCWSWNHVAIVEEIVSEDEIITSESNYGGAAFVRRHRYKSTGWNWSATQFRSGFQGFIYFPGDVESGETTPDPTPSPETPEEPTTPEQDDYSKSLNILLWFLKRRD